MSSLNKISHVLLTTPTTRSTLLIIIILIYSTTTLCLSRLHIKFFFVTPTQCLKSKIQKHVILLLIIFQSLKPHIIIYLFTHLIFKISLFRSIHLKKISNFPIFVNETTYIHNFNFLILK